MSCLRTYVGLCIYSENLSPQEISLRLGIEPSRLALRDLNSKYRGRRNHNFWLWSTHDLIESTDYTVHLKYLFDTLDGKDEILQALRNDGCRAEISCYWDSNGQGGPWLDPETIETLSKLKLGIWWDIYFVREDAPGGA